MTDKEARNAALMAYVKAKQHHAACKQATSAASAAESNAHDDMMSAWRQARNNHTLTRGFYPFPELGNVGIHYNGGDYPELTEVIS